MRGLDQGESDRGITSERSESGGEDLFRSGTAEADEDIGFKFTVDGESYTIQVANTLARRMEAYRFIYKIYQAKGYGIPHESCMWFNKHEMMPGTLTLMVMRGKETVGAATLAPDSALRIPADTAYGEKLDEKRAEGYRVTEVMSLGICPRLRGQREILGTLFSFVHLIPRKLFGSTHLVVTVVPHHVRFYIDQLLFEQEGEFSYHKKTGVTCALAFLDLEKKAGIEESVRDRTFYKYFYTEEGAENTARLIGRQIRPITNREVAFFLSQRSEVLFSLTEEEKRVLLRSEVFEERLTVSA